MPPSNTITRLLTFHTHLPLRLALRYTPTRPTPAPPVQQHTMRPPAPPRVATQTRAPIGDPYILEPEEFAHVVAQLGDPLTSSQKRETLLRLIGIDTAQPLPSEANADTSDIGGVPEQSGAKEKDSDERKEGKGEAQSSFIESEKQQSDRAVPRRLPGTPGPTASQVVSDLGEIGREAQNADVDVDAKKRARSTAADDEADTKGPKAQTDQDQTDDARPAKVARPCARERLMS